MTRKLNTGLIIALLTGWAVLAPEASYLPSIENIAMLGACLFAARLIRNTYARYVFLFWCAWFVIGCVSLYATNLWMFGRDYNLPTSEANRFYLVSVLLAEAAALIFERLRSPRADRIGPRKYISANKALFLFLMLTPLLFALSIVQATGDIPILSGRILTHQMYEEDYGFFYRFGVFTSVACVFLYARNVALVSSERVVTPRLISLVVLGTFLFASAIDGKRVFPMISVMAILLLDSVRPRSIGRLRVWLFGIAGIASYTIMELVRSGKTMAYAAVGVSSAETLWDRVLSVFGIVATSVGVEYRDYVYSFANISREDFLASGYDWAGSTFVGLIPSVLSDNLGLDKSTLVASDSARSLMPFFEVTLGIRIGLPGEIWFAFGWLGCLLFVGFGVLISWMAERAAASSDLIGKSIWLVLVSLWALSVLSQSTVTFGLWLPLLYLGALNFFSTNFWRPPSGNSYFPRMMARTNDDQSVEYS